MEYCTIIIPTLELSIRSTDFILQEMEDKSSLVKEIIIINNNKQDTLSKRYEHLKKVRVISDKPNLYVNPAWNYGVSLVDTKYYGIFNDDIYFNGKLIDDIINLLENNNNLNLTTAFTFTIYDHDFIETTIKETPCEKELIYEIKKYPELKQGWFFIGRTKDWNPINEGTGYRGNIMSGDDSVYLDNQKSYEGVCYITNHTIFHAESTSIKTYIKNKEIYDQISK